MKRYFFHIAYDGSHYHGWQRQVGFRSVQQVIEDSLAKILHLPQVTILGCGRTDAGVHASQYFFHADFAQPLRADLLFILNKTLPADIAVFAILPTTDNLHARFSAQARSYDYFINLVKDPFLKSQSAWYSLQELDLEAMQAAVALLAQHDDYAAFCRQPELHNTTICRVQRAALYTAHKGTRLRFHITANRFLRGQIRILVRKLMDIGTGKFSVDAFAQALHTGQRPPTIFPAPPQGLFLSKVVYSGLNLDNISTLEDENWTLLK
ncbi:MAG: tRNA pseudouridine(38-40) synthase TruA [Aureispira sp.]